MRRSYRAAIQAVLLCALLAAITANSSYANNIARDKSTNNVSQSENLTTTRSMAEPSDHSPRTARITAVLSGFSFLLVAFICWSHIKKGRKL